MGVQNDTIPANVTMNAQATTVGTHMSMAVHDGVATCIESTTTLEGIDNNKTGFSGDASSAVKQISC